jgi:cytochrome c
METDDVRRKGDPMPIGSYFADTFGTYCVIGRRADGYTIARNIATNSTVIFPPLWGDK